MSKSLSVLICACLALASFSSSAATKEYAYSMKITVKAPKGSVAATTAADKTRASSIVLTPCSDAEAPDVISFELSFDAGKNTINTKDPTKNYLALTDAYLFFYNAAARGEAPADATEEEIAANYPQLCERDGVADIPCDPKVVAVVRPALYGGLTALVPLVDVNDIVQADHKYLAKNENLGGKIKESLMRSYMMFDGMSKGTWTVVGIVGPKLDMTDPTAPVTQSMDFTDPSTWAAWDSAAFMLGAPWTVEGQDTSLTCE